MTCPQGLVSMALELLPRTFLQLGQIRMASLFWASFSKLKDTVRRDLREYVCLFEGTDAGHKG